MSSTQLAAFGCYAIAALIAFIFGTTYLTRKEFMPYHADAVERSWNDLDEKIRILIIALMRVAGGGWMASSLAIGILMYFFILQGDPLISLAMTFTGLAVSIPTLLATLIVKRRTKANPPVFAVVIISFET